MATKILMTLLGLTLVLLVACGSAAPAQPEPTVAPAAEPTAAPVESDRSQPTATPQMAAPPAEVEVNPGKLTIMLGDFGNERFHGTFTGLGHDYGRIVHDFLTSDNERKEIVPGIATEWNLSTDGLTWTWTIRKGVKWHDGSEVTPEDVLWTLDHMIGPGAHEYGTVSAYILRSKLTEKIELSGPDSVSLTSTRPLPEMAVMTSRAGPNYFPILPKRAEQYDPEVAAAYDRNPIGAGFMSLEEHVPASVMKFERFDDFYYQPENGLPEDKRVKFQSLDMYLVPEEATRVGALRAGDVDMVPASMAAKEQVEAGGGRLVFSPRASYLGGRWIGCWGPEHACYDKQVRQAFHYAIDKEVIRDRLFGGPEVFEIRGWQYVSPSTSGYTPELDHWPFDPDKARGLLADAGYPGGQGFGKVIVNTGPSTSVPLLIEAAQVMADGWRQVLGVDVEVNVGDSAAFSKAEQAGQLNGQIRWQDNEARIDSTQYIQQTYSDPTHYSVASKDPELIGWAQEVAGTIDEAERNEALKSIIPRLQEESYEFGFGNVSVPWGVGPRVETWEPYPLSPHISALHTITLK